MQATTYEYMYLLASDILPYTNVTGQCILCLPVNPAIRVQMTGWNIFAILYITHFNCLVVEAGFYSQVVECLP